MGFASASSYFVLVAEGELHGAMPTLVVGMWRICPRFHHAHDKRGHGTGLSTTSTKQGKFPNNRHGICCLFAITS
jgi:hypothetical protein